MVKRVTKDLLDKSAIVANDKFPISDSEDLFNPSDPESGQLKRISWGSIQDLLVQNTVTFVVTSDFASGEVIDITDGTGSISGTTTRTIGDTGDITSLGSTASIFNTNASLRVTDNKTIVLKGTEVIWDSATTFHFTRALSAGEWFIIEDGSISGGGTIGNTTVEGTLEVTGDTTLSNTNITGILDVTGDVTLTGNVEVDGCFGIVGSNLVRVTTKECFPSPVGGIITLLPNTLYRIEADINIGTDRFLVQDGTVIEGLGINGIAITYTGTDYMFTGGGVDFSTLKIKFNAPNGKIYNLSSVTNDGISNHREIRIVDCVEIGTFDNIRAVQFFNSSVNNVSGTTGLTLLNNVFIFSISELFIESSVTGVVFIDIGTAIISNFEMNNLILVGSGTSSIGISGTTGSANVTVGSIATVDRSNFLGNITPLQNITEKDIRWEFNGNSANVSNTIEYGEMYIPTDETVTILASGTVYPVNDTNTGGTNIWTEIESSKFGIDSSLGRLTYAGEKPKFFSCTITATVEKVGGGADVIDGYIILNGIPLVHSKSQTENNNPTSITCQAGFTMNENDYIEFGVANENSTSNIIVNISNVTIR